MKNETRIERIEQRKEAVVKIQADRQLHTQELGWLFRPLALCPFPAKPLKKKIIVQGKEIDAGMETIWQRKSGKLTISITSDPRYGIPYGQDILIVLYLAIEARKQKSRKIVVNFYRDFMNLFEMNADDGRKYKLVQQSLGRIRRALYSWEIDSGPTRETGGNYLYIEEWDLHFDPKNPDQRPLWDQYILLSERFWYEINKHKIPFNLEAAKHLKTKPAYLNFFLWLSYRVWNAWDESPGEEVLIPYWGDCGLQNQMSSVIEKRYDFRVQVRNWMKSVKEIWPLCPVEIVDDSLRVFVTSEDQLDVLPLDTDAPQILSGPPKPLPPKIITDVCQSCGNQRTRKPGKTSAKGGYRMPDYWECSGRCKKISVPAKCKHCGQDMTEQRKGRADYMYFCPKCQHYEAGEAYWIKHSVLV